MSIIPKYKISILGNTTTGKTSIINHALYNKFDPSYTSTIGVDFSSKSMTIKGNQVRFQFWDTAGQERFRSLIPNYIRDAGVVMLVYDITNLSAFQAIETWASEVHEISKSIPIILIGNKSDMLDQRKISFDEGKKLSIDIKALYFMEVSAKTGDNILNLMEAIGCYFVGNTTIKNEEEKEIENTKTKEDSKKGISLEEVKLKELISKCKC